MPFHPMAKSLVFNNLGPLLTPRQVPPGLLNSGMERQRTLVVLVAGCCHLCTQLVIRKLETVYTLDRNSCVHRGEFLWPHQSGT
jgi:hypothetical protein